MAQFPARNESAASGSWNDGRDRSAAPIPVARAEGDGDADALLAFGAETASSKPPVSKVRVAAPSRSLRLAMFAGLALLALTAVAAAYVLTRTEMPSVSAVEPVVQTGTATIDSSPAGAEVIIGGVVQGVTPLRLSLPAGGHALEVRHGDSSRALTLAVEPGTLTAQFVELATVPVVSTGRLEVASDPPGAQVIVDGTARGTTPLTVDALAAGPHRVTVSSGSATVSRPVTIEAGATATVMASLTGAANAAGWVGIRAPFELQVYEGGALVGTTNADRLMLPAGDHDLTLVNAAFEFRATRRVQIRPGATATEVVDVPYGSLSVNALPWADVFVDGRPMGTTPLGNLSLPIGSHEIVWRHPELGERRQTVAVKATTPTRIGVDLSQ